MPRMKVGGQWKARECDLRFFRDPVMTAFLVAPESGEPLRLGCGVRGARRAGGLSWGRCGARICVVW